MTWTCFRDAGPYWCAQGNLAIGLSACTTEPYLISVPELVVVTFSTVLTGTIDSTKYMASDKVYLFSGAQDSIVVPGEILVVSCTFRLSSIASQYEVYSKNYSQPCSKIASQNEIYCKNYSHDTNLKQKQTLPTF